MTDDRVSKIEKIPDAKQRALAANAQLEEEQNIINALAAVRLDAMRELLGGGMNQSAVAEVLGMSRARVSQLLSVGTRPERAFFGNGRILVAIGGKRESPDKKSVSEMISSECFTAYEMLGETARAVGLDIGQEVVPPPGVVHLNRPNLIVMTNPRLLPFLAQVMEADPNLRFQQDNKDWILADQSTGETFRSSKDSGGTTDFGYIGRLPRPDGKGTFLYLAGTHAQGTLGATAYLVEHLAELYKELRNRRFSMIVECGVDEERPLQITSVKPVTPVYRHDA